MEEWQREYLKTIRHNLVKSTICNDELLHQLLLDGALANVDLETIRSKPISSDKAHILYDILETRKDGYVAMVKALTECNQAGAQHILLQGYAYCLSRKTPVKFLGKTKRMSEYFDEAEMKEIIEEVKQKLSEKQFSKIYAYPESSSDEVTLVGPRVAPSLPSLYIPRKLFKRIVINKKLFKTNFSDLFVFKGVRTLSQLETMVHPKEASRSGCFLERVSSPPRCLLLENDDHWARILETNHVHTHLIKYEEETNTLVLEMTLGESNTIGQHLERPQGSMKDQNAHKLLSEDNFIDSILDRSITGSGVCICDSPGMGKTLLLAQLACKIAERSADRLVAYVSLPHFIEHVASYGIPPKVDQVYSLNATLEYLSTSPLSLCILTRILKKYQVPMLFLFDGFDEVSSKHINFTKKLLKGFVNFPDTSIIVTSRPHMRHVLEATLGVIAFDITEFTEVNQIEFLVNHWGGDSTEYESDKLAEFARYSLKSPGSQLTKEEQTITGNPLLCRLFAKVYSRKAKRFARSAQNTFIDVESACQFATSLPNVYAKYMKESFKKLASKSESILEAKQYHIWMALKNLFPEFESIYRSEFSVNASHSVMESSFSMGLLDNRITAPEQAATFIHRTFAEYFVAEFLAETLKDLYETESNSQRFKEVFLRFLLETVLVTRDIGDKEDVEGNIFSNPAIVYFFNHLSENLKTDIFAPYISTCISPDRLYSILFGCLRDNYGNIFNFFKATLLSASKGILKRFKSEMIPDGETHLVLRLINIASVCSSVPLVDALFAMFRECFSCDLETVCKAIPLHLDTPLHFAIERADVEKIQYFAKVMSLKDRKLLMSSVIRSNDDCPRIVKRKAELCKLLLSMDKDLLSESSYTLFDSVHVELIRVLIDSGADPKAIRSEETVVHCGSKYMSSSDFHELCRYLIVDCKAEDLFKSNGKWWKRLLLNSIRQQKEFTSRMDAITEHFEQCRSKNEACAFYRTLTGNKKSEHLIKLSEPFEIKWKNPLSTILSRQASLKAETLDMILAISGTDVEERDEFGNTLFLLAVKNGCREELLVTLRNKGADMNTRNLKLKSALHLAVTVGNINKIPFLINLGVDRNQYDRNSNSFVHLLGSADITADTYHDIINLLSIKGPRTDSFLVENDHGVLPLHIAVMHLEVKRETFQIFKSHNADFNFVDKANRSLLMYAVGGRRSLELLGILIELGVDVLLRNCDGQNFAHYITAYTAEQYHQLFITLLSYGYEQAFTITDNNGINPVHLAVHKLELLPETLELIHKTLVESNKVYVNATDKSGHSILMHAALGRRSLAFLKRLLDIGADMMMQTNKGSTFAHIASEMYSAEEYHEIIQLLVEREQQRVFQVADAKGRTPLHLAVEQFVLLPKTLDLIKIKLVQPGVLNINSVDIDGSSILMSTIRCNESILSVRKDTPLTMLSGKGPKQSSSVVTSRLVRTLNRTDMVHGKWQPERIINLLEMGADIHIQNTNGDTFAHYIPFLYPAQQYHSIVEHFIMTGQEKVFQIKNKDGITPIHAAIVCLEPLDVTMNLFHSALFKTKIVDINHCDNDDNSVLVLAAKTRKSVKFLQLLMKMGVNPMIQNVDGDTYAHLLPLNYNSNEYHDILETIICMGQERVFQLFNKRGYPPILAALRELELSADTLDLINVMLFQTKTVDVNFCDANGDSLLTNAALGGRSVEFLIKLMKTGVNLMSQNIHGNTLVHVVAYHYTPEEYHDILELIIQMGQERTFQAVNNAGETAICTAIRELELSDKTLDLVSDALVETQIVEINDGAVNGHSCLMCAVIGGRSIRFLQKLMQIGADPMIQNKDGDSFLHLLPSYYTLQRCHDAIELIIRTGRQRVFQIVNNTGETFLHLAILRLELTEATLDLINSKLIQTNIVDINLRSKIGDTFLFYAVMGSRTAKTLYHLMKIGVNHLSQNEDGDTFAHVLPHYYTPQEYHNVVESIIRTGYPEVFQITNNKGQTPIHVALYNLELLPSTLDLLNSTLFQTNIVNINSCDIAGNSLLMYAATGRRSFRILENLMKMGVDAMIQNENLDTFVHLIPSYYDTAHRYEYQDFIESVIQMGLQNIFQVLNNIGQTPLHIAEPKFELHLATLELVESAIFKKHVDVFEDYVYEEANDINCRGTIYFNEIDERVEAILKKLMKNGVEHATQNKDGDTFLHLIPCFVTPQQYHKLVEFIIRIRQQGAFRVLNKNGDTPLHKAIQKLELLDKTLDLMNCTLFQTNIVNINHTSKVGDSLLAYAVMGSRSVKLLEKLLKIGVDPTIRNDDGSNVAHLIPFYYNQEEYHVIVEFIIEEDQGKLFLVENNFGHGPLMYAVYKLEMLRETVNLLAACLMSLEDEIQESSVQANRPQGINAVDKNGDSVLNWALGGKRSLQLVKQLVSLGANWSLKNNDSNNLAHIAVTYDLLEHAKYFVQLGCDVNAVDCHGNNVLHCAAQDASENIYEMLTFLVEQGADRLHKNNMAKTAYTYVTERGVTDERILDVLQCGLLKGSCAPPRVKHVYNPNETDASTQQRPKHTSNHLRLTHAATIDEYLHSRAICTSDHGVNAQDVIKTQCTHKHRRAHTTLTQASTHLGSNVDPDPKYCLRESYPGIAWKMMDTSDVYPMKRNYQ